MQVYVFVAPNHSCRSSEKGQITLIYNTSIHAFMNSFIQYKCKLSGILGAVNAKVEKNGTVQGFQLKMWIWNILEYNTF